MIADAVRRDDAAGPIGNREEVLEQDALTYIVQDFKAVHKFAALLRKEDPRQDVLVEPVFDSEVTLEVIVEEVCKLVLQIFS